VIMLTDDQKNAFEIEKNGQHEFRTRLIVGDMLRVDW
jgi:hypothetical protein